MDSGLLKLINQETMQFSLESSICDNRKDQLFPHSTVYSRHYVDF